MRSLLRARTTCARPLALLRTGIVGLAIASALFLLMGNAAPAHPTGGGRTSGSVPDSQTPPTSAPALDATSSPTNPATGGPTSAPVVTPVTSAPAPVAASISGTVTALGRGPLASICVSAHTVRSGQRDSVGSAITGADGRYSIGQLPSGDVRVQFRDCNNTGAYVEQWWNAAHGFATAPLLTLVAGQPAGGVDAALVQGGVIMGTVTDRSGSPARNLCVSATPGDGAADVSVGTSTNVSPSVGSADTDNSGRYRVIAPAGVDRVRFADCHNIGPFVDRWWTGVNDLRAATPITVAVGQVVTRVDISLTVTAALTGHVSDIAGLPLAGICVSAIGSTEVGGGAKTDGNGDYSVRLTQAGTYRVQFVDCNEIPAYAGGWWTAQNAPPGPTPIAALAGSTSDNVDATLTAGGLGTISGKVTNLAGLAMRTACVAATVPSGGLRVATIGGDGTYTLANLGSGSYFLAFFDCHQGGSVSDPATGLPTYSSAWWTAHPTTTGDPQRADPVARAAEPIVVAPSTAITGYDHCFGCDAIDITALVPAQGQIIVTFTNPTLSTNGRTLAFTSACSSSDGGAAGSTVGLRAATASGVRSTSAVTGLTDGKNYTCTVTAADGHSTVASSRPFPSTLVGPFGRAATPATPATSTTTTTTTTTTPASATTVPPTTQVVASTLTTSPLLAAAVETRVLGISLLGARSSRPGASGGSGDLAVTGASGDLEVTGPPGDIPGTGPAGDLAMTGPTGISTLLWLGVGLVGLGSILAVGTRRRRSSGACELCHTAASHIENERRPQPCVVGVVPSDGCSTATATTRAASLP